MKILKFILSTCVLIGIVYCLNNRFVIKGNAVPPLGKFLNPFRGAWHNASDNYEFLSARLPGLKEAVSIQYDTQGVPHILAKNNHDLYMAQGYIIAQDRLWQMEFQTHAAAGRISELIGARGLNFDRLQRRKGMTYGAARTQETMMADPKIKAWLEAYANGVNAYINSLSYEDLPIEYKLLGYEPEPWTPFKSALILEYMIDNLTGFDNDLENTNALKLFGEETFKFLFPEWLPGNDPVIPTDKPWNFDAENIKNSTVALHTTHKTFPKPDPDNGSNNWAVSGSKTASGHAILANDTHLNLNLPSLWYMIQLTSPDVNVYGFTFTGALGVTIGFNDSIAWGFTNAPRDHRDWYKITFKDSDRKEYLYDSGWRATKEHIEVIKIRDADTYYDTVTYTHHGPVVYDESFGDHNPQTNYALRWIGHDPSRVQQALMGLNRGENYSDYRKAIALWDAPPQNIVFAATNGDIALTVQGQYVNKPRGMGKFILDGSNPANDWGAYISEDQNPFQYNPDRGFVSSANQHSVDTLYPHWVYYPHYEYYRNRTINRNLSEMNNITPTDMMRLQNDSYNLLAAEILPLMLDSLKGSNTNKSIIKALKQWDYHHDVDLRTPVMFELWWEELYKTLWDEFAQANVPLEKPNDYTTTYILKNYPTYKMMDITATQQKETLTDIVNTSFEKALGHFNDQSQDWGEYKDTYVRHLADLGGSLAGFSRYHIRVNGQANAINSTKRNHGPSERFIVEMSSPPKAWGIYPGGQSGNPGSPLYDNMLDMWRDAEYLPLIFISQSEPHTEDMSFTQTLTPEP